MPHLGQLDFDFSSLVGEIPWKEIIGQIPGWIDDDDDDDRRPRPRPTRPRKPKPRPRPKRRVRPVVRRRRRRARPPARRRVPIGQIAAIGVPIAIAGLVLGMVMSR